MRRDHRPYWLARSWVKLQQAWARHFLEPQLESLGEGSLFLRPWHVRIHGPRIRLGRFAHVIGARGHPVSLCTWDADGGRGSIEIGDHCLICPGVRLTAAGAISIGDGSMLAAEAVISDADWHDIHDRTRAVGATRPVRLARNVWIGERATITKGVTNGENAIVGAGAVVASDVPANAIAAGNPARVVRRLDPSRRVVTRAELFRGDARRIEAENAYVMLCALRGNGLLGWLRSLIAPRRGD